MLGISESHLKGCDIMNGREKDERGYGRDFYDIVIINWSPVWRVGKG